MRFVFVPIVVLASVTFAAAQIANIDPTVAPPTLAVTKTPPPPASVNVLNFPETQAVAGTVTVDNLPAVQTVGGTVSVGNLPTDADGAVRVSSASGRQPLLIDLPTGELLIDCNVPFVSPVVDARGYSRVGIRLDGSSAIGGIIEWRWDGDAPNSFFRVYNANDSNGSPGGDCTGNINSSYGHICAVSGADLRVTVSNPYCNGPNPLRGIKVYLIP